MDSLEQSLSSQGSGRPTSASSRPESASSTPASTPASQHVHASSSSMTRNTSSSGILSQAGASSFYKKDLRSNEPQQQRRRNSATADYGSDSLATSDKTKHPHAKGGARYKKTTKQHVPGQDEEREQHQVQLNKQRNFAAQKLFGGAVSRSRSSHGLRQNPTKLKADKTGIVKTRKPGDSTKLQSTETDAKSHSNTVERTDGRPRSPIELPAKKNLRQRGQQSESKDATETKQGEEEEAKQMERASYNDETASNGQHSFKPEEQESQEEQEKRRLMEKGMEEIRNLDRQLLEVSDRAKKASQSQEESEKQIYATEEERKAESLKQRQALYEKLGFSSRMTRKMVGNNNVSDEHVRSTMDSSNVAPDTVHNAVTSTPFTCSKQTESIPTHHNPQLRKDDKRVDKENHMSTYQIPEETLTSTTRGELQLDLQNELGVSPRSTNEEREYAGYSPDSHSYIESPNGHDTKRSGGTGGSQDFVKRNKDLVGHPSKRLTEEEEEKLRVWLEEETDTSTEGEASDEEGETNQSDIKSRSCKTEQSASRDIASHPASEEQWNSSEFSNSRASSKRKKGNAYKIKHNVKERMSKLDEELSAYSEYSDKASTHSNSLHAAQLKLFPFFMTMVEEDPFDDAGSNTGNYRQNYKQNNIGSLSAIYEDYEESPENPEGGTARTDDKKQDNGRLARDHVFSTDENPYVRSRPPSAAFSVNTKHESASQCPTPRGNSGSSQTSDQRSRVGRDPVIEEQRKQRLEKRQTRRLEMIDSALSSLSSRKHEAVLQDLPSNGSENQGSLRRPPTADSTASSAVEEYLQAKSKYESWQSSRRGSSRRSSSNFNELKSIATAQRPITRKDIEIESARCKSTISEDKMASREDIEKLVGELRNEFHLETDVPESELENFLENSDGTSDEDEDNHYSPHPSRQSKWNLRSGDETATATAKQSSAKEESESRKQQENRFSMAVPNENQSSNADEDETDETMPEDKDEIARYASNLVAQYTQSQGKETTQVDSKEDKESYDEDEEYEKELHSLREELKNMKFGRMQLRDAVAEAEALYAPERWKARQQRWEEENEAQMCAAPPANEKDIVETTLEQDVPVSGEEEFPYAMTAEQPAEMKDQLHAPDEEGGPMG
eukprot:gb/GECG01008392.1/.p1 GENE.gb/GECG01008392.1/~~gb/GECG01008392.1/.p1  ORF type:complete len:1127 (+),score=246.03 gb/GECG01008392.1/:1-3381(+)